MVRWQRQGLVYCPKGEHGFDRSHASQPTVDVMADSWRIYFASRDEQNRSHVTHLDVAPGRPDRILRVHDRPILPLGELGTFDESGIMPSSIVDHGGRKYLYYIGWSLRRTVPYHNAIGLAVSDDGGRTFAKIAPGPIFGLTHLEPHFTGTSCVRIEDGVWKNWYMSCTRWEEVDGQPEPFYHIKYAESEDGIHWQRRGQVSVDYRDPGEGGIVRASVLRERDGWHMWYCYRRGRAYRTDRAASYRIGYAVSSDGVTFERRDDQAGIDVAGDGWDSQMLAYPDVVRHGRRLFLFYNGNGFGRTGFGWALAEAP
jgi:hypothetical protein